tara:strand:- start:243 stop:1046 length:804 start_codon:yes stop_codon:yes gene_type:complete
MIKILPILTFLFLTLYASGQECQYEEYFRLTDLAKNDCKKENFKESKRNFQLAFEKVEFPLGHDLSYALYTADKLKDDQWAGHIAKKLAKGGIPLRYFAKFKKKKWYKKFESDFSNFTEHFKKHFNVEMQNRFLKISQDDYEFNNQYHEWRERKIELTLQELIDGATKIISDFENFNDKYGFPNEQQMGYNYVRRKNSIEPYKIGVLMIHIYQRGLLIFKDDIDDFICKGGLHSGYKKTLKEIRGFGNSTGIAQEMEARYAKYRGAE